MPDGFTEQELLDIEVEINNYLAETTEIDSDAHNKKMLVAAAISSS